MTQWFSNLLGSTLDFSNTLNVSISAGWLILVVLLLRLLLRKAPKWVAVMLWGLVALRLIMPFSIESVFSLLPNPETVSGELLQAEQVSGTQQAYLEIVTNPSLGRPVTVTLDQTVSSFQWGLVKLNLIWLLGICVMTAYALISYFSLRKKVNTAVCCHRNIYQSEYVASPFVLGILKPRIYLPFHVDELTMEHIVAHEQAHIRRKDHLWKPLGFLLLTIHWFNPLIWLAYILLCRDIELACDEKVIKGLAHERRADYTQALVICSVNRYRIAACPLAFGETGVKTRVKSIMNYKKPAFWIVTAAVLVCVAAAVCFLTVPPEQQQDLSLLNYKNAVSVASNLEELQVIKCPADEFSIQVGAASGAELAKQLEQWSWRECKAPRWSLLSPGSVEFFLSDDYRITVHQRKSGSLRQYAVVTYQDETRYYSIHRSDYADAVALVYAPALAPVVSQSFQATVLAAYDGMLLVAPADGSEELDYASQLEVVIQNMEPSPEPEQGDIVEICYNGELMDAEIPRIEEVYGIQVIREAKTLSLNDVIMLAGKGYALTWSDFDGFRYIETGSGLYIRVYEINEMYELWIGGNDSVTEPMYIYLSVADHPDTRIDIRDGGVTEFLELCKEEVIAFMLHFAGNTSIQNELVLTEEKPFWRICVENAGSSYPIVVEINGHVTRIEAGTSGTVTTDETWKPGSYAVSFASAAPGGMQGTAIAKVFASEPAIELQP